MNKTILIAFLGSPASHLDPILSGVSKLPRRRLSTPLSFLVSSSSFRINPTMECYRHAIRSVWGNHLQNNLWNYHCPLPIWNRNESGKGRGDLFLIMSAGSLFQCQTLSFDLDTEQRGVSRTLHESGIQFLVQLDSTLAGSLEWGRGWSLLWQTSKRHTADASGWQVQ